MKAVFDVREKDNKYQDRLPERYFFGTRYLILARRCVGDWVLFRQPRAGGGDRAYFAAARVVKIGARAPGSDQHFAEFEDFLPFAHRVPWRPKTGYWEAALRSVADVTKVGRYVEGRSVRQITNEDFGAIIYAGLGSELAEQAGLVPSVSHTPILDYDRLRRTSPNGRLVRERSFQQAVLTAYRGRCAFTGLRIIDAAGRSEAQAAHIWSVEEGGPDAVQNGIALSSIAHWMFDRRLVVLTENLGLIVDRKRVPRELLAMIHPQLKRIILPTDVSLCPHREYIDRKYR